MISNLDQKLRTVCPIEGVDSNRRISFAPEATPDQRQAAQIIADTWDFDAQDKLALDAQKAQTDMAAATAAAVATLIIERSKAPNPPPEVAQAAAALAVAKPA